MTNKNESNNTGGERFQKRLKGEQRVRTTKTKESASRKPPGGNKSGFNRNQTGFGSAGEGGFRKKFDNKPDSRSGTRPKSTRSGSEISREYSQTKRVFRRDSDQGEDSFKRKPRNFGDKPTPRNNEYRNTGKSNLKRFSSDEERPSFRRKKPDSTEYSGSNRFSGNKREQTGEGRFPKRDFSGEERPSFRRKKPDSTEYSGSNRFSGNKREQTGEGRFPKRTSSNKPEFSKSDRGNQTEFKSSSYKTEGTRGSFSSKPGADKPKREYKPRSIKTEKGTQAANFKGRGKQLRETSGMLEKGASLANDEVRLNRFIAMSGSYSRREADAFIAEGRVSINGTVVTELGTKVQPGDSVKLDGQKIAAQKPVYILLNKPKGYVTTTEDPEGRQTVMDLIQLPAADNLFPVGRLDRNTTGVLLITNDGDLAQKIMHPSFNIKKIYRVKLDRKPSREHMLEWIAGVDLEDGRMSFEQVGFVEKEEPTVLGVEIHSGRNRVVRRMFEHFGYEVKSLDRVLLGEFDKLNLGRGRWRFLNDKEMRYVMKIKARKNKTSARK
ncbi:MAG: rRNA pseudouridine synthase [Bacteroidetes bacterium]|nr:rRNA pseudouridine synthase [Bacteroidota bacterium]